MNEMMPKRRPGPFGPAKALLPSGQEVLVVPETSQAWDALERMIDDDFSQVPVINDDGHVTGVFSWKSFGKRVLDLRGNKLDATELCVRDCMEDAIFITPETYIDTDKATDWSQVDYVLVGAAEQVIGVLSVSDVFGRLNDFAEAFVLLYEVELDLRDVISEVLSSEEIESVCGDFTQSTPPLRELAERICDEYDGVVAPERLDPLVAELAPKNVRPIRSLEELSFSHYLEIVCSKKRWPRFEPLFISPRELVQADMKQVNDLRNVVFHFRRQITTRDTDRMRRFRDKLRVDWHRFKIHRGATLAQQDEVEEETAVEPPDGTSA